MEQAMKRLNKLEKTEPNVLDRLFNVVVSDRSAKAMLIAQAKPMPAACLELGLSERAAREKISADLKAWLHASGITGRGTKKLVDKVAARAMRGYSSDLRRLLHQEAQGAEEEDAITAELKAGQVGRGTDGRRPAWLRRSIARRGARLAGSFQQKSR